jgi:hypothetical protein
MSTLFLTSYVALWILVLLQMVALVAIYHFFGSVILNAERDRKEQVSLEYGRLGVKRPYLLTVSGDRVPLSDRREPLLLVFLSTTCQTCDRLVGQLAEVAADRTLSFAVVCEGPDVEEVVRWIGARTGFGVVFDDRREIARELGIASYPFAIGLDRGGLVRLTGPIDDGEQLRQIARLVERDDTFADDVTSKEREVNRVDTHLDGHRLKDEPQPIR